MNKLTLPLLFSFSALGAGAADMTGSLEYVANPASTFYKNDSADRIAAARSCREIFLYRNRLYVGMGDSSKNTGETPIFSVDPYSGQVTKEWLSGSEEISEFKVFSDGLLYMTGHDPVENSIYQGNYFRRATDGTWKNFNHIPGGNNEGDALKTHNWGIAEIDGYLHWAGYGIASSSDMGATWVKTSVGQTSAYERQSYVRANGAKGSVTELARVTGFVKAGNDVYGMPSQAFCVDASNPEGGGHYLWKFNRSTGNFSRDTSISWSQIMPGLTVADAALGKNQMGGYDSLKFVKCTLLGTRSLYIASATRPSCGNNSVSCSEVIPWAAYLASTNAAGAFQAKKIDFGANTWPWDFAVRNGKVYALCFSFDGTPTNVVNKLFQSSDGETFEELLRFNHRQYAQTVDYCGGAFYFAFGSNDALTNPTCAEFTESTAANGNVCRIRFPMAPLTAEVETAEIVVPEGGAGVARFRLVSAPAAPLNLAVAATGSSDLSVGVASLTFTPENWNVWQEVPFALANDHDDDSDPGAVVCGFDSTEVTPAACRITAVNDEASPVISWPKAFKRGATSFGTSVHLDTLGLDDGTNMTAATVTVNVYTNSSRTQLLGSWTRQVAHPGIVAFDVSGTRPSFTHYLRVKVTSANGLSASRDYTVTTVAEDTPGYAPRAGTSDLARFAHAVKFVVQGVEEDVALDDFPVLVRLREGATGLQGFRYADFRQADGADMIFSDLEGNVLPHEVDTWNPNGESLVWVKVARLRRGARIVLRYGADGPSANDPAAVWSRYVGVWHLGGSGRDSTRDGWTATCDGNCGPTDGGLIGGGVTNGRVLCELPLWRLADSRRFTVTGWYKATANNLHAHLFSTRLYYDSPGTTLTYLTNRGLCLSSSCALEQGVTYAATPSEAMPLDTWQHLAGRFDCDQGALYRDGAPLASGTVNVPTTHRTTASENVADEDILAMGGYNGYVKGSFFSGTMDELRVFDGAATPAWLKAENDAVRRADFLAYSTDGRWPDDPPGQSTVVVRSLEPDFGADFGVLEARVALDTAASSLDDGLTWTLASGDGVVTGVCDRANGVVTFGGLAVRRSEANDCVLTAAEESGVRYERTFAVRGGRFSDSWICEDEEHAGETGDWRNKTGYENGSVTVFGTDGFVPSSGASDGNRVTVRMTVGFDTAVTEEVADGAQLALRLNGDTFQVLAGAPPEWLDVAAEGVAAEPLRDYEFIFEIDYGVGDYGISVVVGDSSVPLAADGETRFLLARADTNGVSEICFNGSGEVASIYGEFVDASVARADGVRYDTLADATASGRPVTVTWAKAVSGDALANAARGSDLTLPAYAEPTSVRLAPGVTVRPAANQLPGLLAFLSPASWFDVVTRDGAATLALNVSATPEIGSADEPALVVEGAMVRLSVANAKPGLSYALSSVTNLAEPFAEPKDGWQRFDGTAEGTTTLTTETTVPAAFYKVFVSDR